LDAVRILNWESEGWWNYALPIGKSVSGIAAETPAVWRIGCFAKYINSGADSTSNKKSCIALTANSSYNFNAIGIWVIRWWYYTISWLNAVSVIASEAVSSGKIKGFA
jgi:hypothetical protein